MKIDRGVSQLSGTRSNIYTATQNGEIIFSLLAISSKACNLYLVRSAGETSVEYTVRLAANTTWRLPGKVVLRAGEGFSAKVMEVNTIDWHSLPDWDLNSDWDNPGEITPLSAIAQIDLSVIQI